MNDTVLNGAWESGISQCSEILRLRALRWGRFHDSYADNFPFGKSPFY